MNKGFLSKVKVAVTRMSTGYVLIFSHVNFFSLPIVLACDEETYLIYLVLCDVGKLPFHYKILLGALGGGHFIENYM